MLQKPKDLAEMILMDLRHHCAEDPETGAYLIRSDGRRKSGRPRKYWYRAPGMINAKVIYAESDDDAIRQIEGDAPNNACTGLAGTMATESNIEEPASR